MSESDADQRIGEEAGPYRVVAQLGAGGMGEVYLAEDRRLGRKVALKLLPRAFTLDADRVTRFEREAQAASALSHPNILTVYDVGEIGGTRFIATEYVEGVTLRERLRAGPVPLHEVLEIGVQASGALAAAHRAGIVHRDIKPENLMLRADGLLKVLDFGLAKLAETPAAKDDRTVTAARETKPGTVLGTIGYMSPEQVRGLTLDGRSDIFSLGVVLYELIRGESPFGGASTADLMAAILRSDPPPLAEQLPSIPERFEQIIARALAKERDARYATAQELRDDLQALAGELDFEAKLRSRPSGTLLSGRIRAAAAKHRALVAVVAVLAALGAAALYWRSARLRWATAQIPRIEALAREQRFFEAHDLAVEALGRAPGDATLARLAQSVSDPISVKTEPPGAQVYLRRFRPAAPAEASARRLAGTTPLVDHRVPRGEYLLSIEKEGFSTFERTISNTLVRAGMTLVPQDEPVRLEIKLVESGRVPERMVFVLGGTYRLLGWGRPSDARVELGDYFIDRYEVTNREFKEFISAGGYLRKEFWKTEVARNGKPLAWEEAMRQFRDRTGLPGPRGWSGQEFPAATAEHPVTDVTWYEAAAYAAFRGKELPTAFQWEKAARPSVISYGSETIMPWGPIEASGTVEGRANFKSRGSMAVGTLEFGMSPFGCYHMAGNVAEWCRNELGSGFATMGGSWDDPAYLFSRIGEFPGLYSSPQLGFRCVRNVAPGTSDQGALRLDPPDILAVAVARDPHEPSFDSLLRAFHYDATPLGAQVVETRESADWRREKIAYRGANDERALGYLYLPHSASPPYQVLNFVPAGDVFGAYVTTPESVEMFLAAHLKSGRAVWSVVFKGFKERDHPPGYRPPAWTSVRRREIVVANDIDLRRGVDYLTTRPEIDPSRLVYYGFSRGSEEGMIYSSVEPRYRAAVFVSGGLSPTNPRWIAEARPMLFAPHIAVPVLMLNGRYDEVYPLQTAIEPLYSLLRAPKKLVLYDAGHSPPIEIEARTVIPWLDETVGPVRR